VFKPNVFNVLFNNIYLISSVGIAFCLRDGQIIFYFIQAPGVFILFTEQTFYLGPNRSPIQWEK